MMGFGFLLMLGVWVVIIIAAIWVGKTLLNQQDDPFLPQSKSQKESALDILEIRYARGEITRDEFEAMKQDISN
jgi:putative membrane protein